MLDEKLVKLYFHALGMEFSLGVALNDLGYLSGCRFPDCAGVPRHKIRGESSSNGSECGVPVSLLTKIRAELSSNGSWLSRRSLELMDTGSL